jgi:tetraacyldisaccharide 4'-kinase
MRPPEFWTQGGRRALAIEALLAPVSLFYEWAGAAKLKNAKSEHVSATVICVGNVTLGGVGKTPVVRAITQKLRARGVNAHTLSRGYGGTARGPLRVDPALHNSEAVGDEPLLLAADGPAWIAHDRAAGARAAVQAGAQAIVMDDGFQNPSLAKDLSILVFDAQAGLGNNKVFPSGPLREPLAKALKRADLAIVMGDGPTPWLNTSFPVLRAKLAPQGAPPAGKLLAFAGIGRPEKFFDTLKAAGADVDDLIPFADHHAFTKNDLTFLERLATERGAKMITTEKDFARLPMPWRERVSVLPVIAAFDDDAALDAALAGALASAPKAR